MIKKLFNKLMPSRKCQKCGKYLKRTAFEKNQSKCKGCIQKEEEQKKQEAAEEEQKKQEAAEEEQKKSIEHKQAEILKQFYEDDNHDKEKKEKLTDTKIKLDNEQEEQNTHFLRQ